MSRLLFPALCVAAATMAGVIALELATAPGDAPAQRIATRDTSPQPALQQVDPVPGQIAALLARPLFSPSRRPDAADGSQDPRLPHLTGILVTTGDRKAIFAGRDGGRGAVVGLGDQVGAYRVTDISAADVTLVGADGTHAVRPTYSMAPPPGPLAIPAGLPPPGVPLFSVPPALPVAAGPR